MLDAQPNTKSRIMDEERYLIEMIEMIAEAHRKAAEPYVNRLVALRSMRLPPRFVLSADVLEHMPSTLPGLDLPHEPV